MKNKFFRTTLLLIIGGFITKLLSLIIKVVLTRNISTETLGLYMMITPTLMLVISISQAGLPTALSKLIAEEDTSSKKLFLSIFPISVIINTFLMIFIFVFAKTLSINLLHNKDLYLGVIAIALVIPFTSISSIIRSYFFGKSKVLPHIISNIIESIFRLLIYYYYLPVISNKSLSYILCFLILSNVLAEIVSIITLLIFLPKNIDLRKKDLVPNPKYIKNTLAIAIPNTASRLIGSIGYFFEPIILTSILRKVGYSTKYITFQYGVITGYVIPLILMPSFFSMAISQSLLPNISYEYSNNNIKGVKRKLKLAIFLSIIIGLFFTSLFIIFPDTLLKLIYHTNSGSNYLRILAPIFFIQYIEIILSTTLEATNNSIFVLKGNIIATIIRLLSLFIFSLFRIGIYPLIISTLLNVFITTFYYYRRIDKILS